MKEEAEQRLRCRPGDLARVVHSTNPALIDQIVVVERWRQDHGRWAVCLLGGAVLGVTLSGREPVVTSRYGFRDSSLEPLSPEITVSPAFEASRRRQAYPIQEAFEASARTSG